MAYQAQLSYSETLIRRAVFSFWKRTVGPGVRIALVIVAIAAAVLLPGNHTWVGSIFGTVVVVYVGFLAMIYVVHLRNSIAKFRDLGEEAIATFAAEEATFTVTSDIGSSTLRWSTIQEVWRFSKFWLVLFSKAQFMIIPLEDIDQDMQLFVLEKVRANGGKVQNEAS